MNNKGFTVIELIVTFAFVMLLTVNLMNVVNNFRDNASSLSTNKSSNMYRNTIIKLLEEDVNAYAVKSIDVLRGEDITNKKTVTINGKSQSLTFDRGVKLCFYLPNECKILLLRNKGGDKEETDSDYQSRALIYYGPEGMTGKTYVAPDKYLTIVGYKILPSKKTYGNSTIYNIFIPMYNDKTDEYFDVDFYVTTVPESTTPTS